MNDCACVYVDTYGEPPSFFKEELRRARKVHICIECQREIQPGEKYEYAVGVWEGQFDQIKTCSDCLSIRKVMFCEGWLYYGLIEDLKEHVWGVNGNISEDCLVLLTPSARSMVCEIIERVWERE